jgi:hypothetical protein
MIFKIKGTIERVNVSVGIHKWPWHLFIGSESAKGG